jgi:hypothetical protein
MDLFGYVYPIAWFTWDLCNNFIILIKTRQWVKGSVHDTKDQVKTMLLEPATTAELKAALDIPDRTDIQKITDKVQEMELQLEAKMIELTAKLEAIKMPELDKLKLEFDEETLNDISDKIVSRVSGYKGQLMKAERAEMKKVGKEMQEEYLNSPEWEAENAEKIKLVQDYMPDRSYGLAKVAVKRGPTFVDNLAKAKLDREDYELFRSAWDELSKLAAEKPVNTQGGWWGR